MRPAAGPADGHRVVGADVIEDGPCIVHDVGDRASCTPARRAVAGPIERHAAESTLGPAASTRGAVGHGCRRCAHVNNSTSLPGGPAWYRSRLRPSGVWIEPVRAADVIGAKAVARTSRRGYHSSPSRTRSAGYHCPPDDHRPERLHAPPRAIRNSACSTVLLITELVDTAAQLGMDSMAITDHGALYGAVAFYQAARNCCTPIIKSRPTSPAGRWSTRKARPTLSCST